MAIPTECPACDMGRWSLYWFSFCFHTIQKAECLPSYCHCPINVLHVYRLSLYWHQRRFLALRRLDLSILLENVLGIVNADLETPVSFKASFTCSSTSSFVCAHELLHESAYTLKLLNTLNAELNPIRCLLALLGAHHFLHVSRIRVKSLTLRLLMS